MRFLEYAHSKAKWPACCSWKYRLTYVSHLAFGIQTKHFRGTVKPMVGRNVASIDTTIVVVPGLATANVGENHKLVVRVDQRIFGQNSRRVGFGNTIGTSICQPNTQTRRVLTGTRQNVTFSLVPLDPS